MRVLVVDDDIDFRGLARVLLQRNFPRVDVSEYDPEVFGMPPESFPWADYDVVLLDHELRAEHTGLDWLRRFSKLPGFPSVIFTTGTGDEYLAARAMKLGADEYLSKRDVTAARLGELVGSVLAARTVPAEPSPNSEPTSRDTASTDASASDALASVGYTLRRLLGCGGTADVYLAERIGDGLTVVVKLLREAMAGDDVEIRRFIDEAHVLDSLDSPHVVRVYGHGVKAQRSYLIMEYMGHGDLRSRISEGILPGQALDYLRAIMGGLISVHSHGIVHRDLKPSNVMFRYDDSLALTDFGIAKRLGTELNLTTSDSIIGTPAYVSPEQCDGKEADARSDIYSAGVMLFEMLTGIRPFHGESAAVLFMQHSTAPVPQLPEALSKFQPFVDRLMAKRTEDRYQSAGAVLEALQSFRH